jgi:hypothetical protein
MQRTASKESSMVCLQILRCSFNYNILLFFCGYLITIGSGILGLLVKAAKRNRQSSLGGVGLVVFFFMGLFHPFFTQLLMPSGHCCIT